MNIINYIIILIALVICGGLIIYNRYKEKQVLSMLNEMLDSAIDERFTEDTYDESMLSALETKLNRYLSKNYVSSKKMKEEKEHIKALISDISHQTKTPIANISLYSNLLLENSKDEEEKELAHNVVVQSEKLNFLITSLIKASRLETGIISLIPKKNQIALLIEEVYKELNTKAENKGIKLVYSVIEQQAVFDMKWTLEALGNIVDNAIKYTKSGGTVSILSTAYEMFVKIDITDSGIGISEDEHSKIFTRFYRSSSVSEEDGAGIGLYLTREIIGAQGGYIKLTSKLNEGSTFSVFLAR